MNLMESPVLQYAKDPFPASISAALTAAFPDLEALYLFGSSGTEYETSQSDIDIAVLLPFVTAKGCGPKRFFELSEMLASLAGRTVDLINLRAANTVFQTEILRSGRIVYVADTHAVAVFEMLTLSYYQKLNEERSGILKGIVETGKVLLP